MFEVFSGKKVLVTGGAGFIGSHLVDRLLELGAEVIVLDNFITGSRENLNHIDPQKIKLIEADVAQTVSNYLPQPVDFIFHLASPASPDGYMRHPVETYMANGMGTHYLCEYVKDKGGRLVFASTSEAYGDPLETPQKETYWGNVNPIGPRACYDESKRFGEMVVSNFVRNDSIDARTVRIFNTYGPRMAADDGRVVPNFVMQALKNEPITVHDDGQQTRSFCYVADLVEYLMRMMVVKEAEGKVINIGKPGEMTMLKLAEKIKDLSQSGSKIEFTKGREEDVNRREPDISVAKEVLAFEPQTLIDKGMKETIAYFRKKI